MKPHIEEMPNLDRDLTTEVLDLSDANQVLVRDPTPCPHCLDKGYTVQHDGPKANYISCTCRIGLQFARQYCSPEKEPTDDV